MRRKIIDEKGTWIVENGTKYLIKPSKKHEDERKKEAEKEEIKLKKQELNKLGYELISELPDLIAEFYPIIQKMLKVANITLTAEQKAMIKKYIDLKKEIND